MKWGSMMNIDNNKEKLKQIDEKVYSCNLCNNLVEKFPNDTTVFLGKDNDIF